MRGLLDEVNISIHTGTRTKKKLLLLIRYNAISDLSEVQGRGDTWQYVACGQY